MIKALDFHNDTAYLNSDRPSTSHTAAATNTYIDDDENIQKITMGLDDDQMLSTQYYDTTGFDSVAGEVWIYPNNMPTRSYQYTIVEQCLYKNTMVVLPTGLGKTFIAVSY